MAVVRAAMASREVADMACRLVTRAAMAHTVVVREAMASREVDMAARVVREAMASREEDIRANLIQLLAMVVVDMADNNK